MFVFVAPLTCWFLPRIVRISIPKCSWKTSLAFWRFFSLSLFALFWDSITRKRKPGRERQYVTVKYQVTQLRKKRRKIKKQFWHINLHSFLLTWSSLSLCIFWMMSSFCISFCCTSEANSEISWCFSFSDAFFCSKSERQNISLEWTNKPSVKIDFLIKINFSGIDGASTNHFHTVYLQKTNTQQSRNVRWANA